MDLILLEPLQPREEVAPRSSTCFDCHMNSDTRRFLFARAVRAWPAPAARRSAYRLRETVRGGVNCMPPAWWHRSSCQSWIVREKSTCRRCDGLEWVHENHPWDMHNPRGCEWRRRRSCPDRYPLQRDANSFDSYAVDVRSFASQRQRDMLSKLRYQSDKRRACSRGGDFTARHGGVHNGGVDNSCCWGFSSCSLTWRRLST